MTRSGAIIIEDNRVALIKRMRQEHEYYLFPGGQVEPGEDLRDAAAREVYEELGLRVAIGVEIAIVIYNGATQHYFAATVIGGSFGTGTGEELSSDA